MSDTEIMLNADTVTLLESIACDASWMTSHEVQNLLWLRTSDNVNVSLATLLSRVHHHVEMLLHTYAPVCAGVVMDHLTIGIETDAQSRTGLALHFDFTGIPLSGVAHLERFFHFGQPLLDVFLERFGLETAWHIPELPANLFFLRG